MFAPLRTLFLVPTLAVCLVGCSRPEATITDAGVTRDATRDAATAPARADAATSASKPEDAGAPSSKARAAVVRDLNEGRKLSRAKDWAGATKAFERALEVAPDDVHVLSELGWAAFQANDLARAGSANKRALANAKDPKVRAPILYNIGRVAEARGDKQAANKAYTESLALRDNAEVKKRLAGAGDAGPADAYAMPCGLPVASVDALCTCLRGRKDDIWPMDAPIGCRAAPSSLALGDSRLGVVLWGAESIGEKAHLLTVREADLLRPVAELGRDYEPGAFGVHNVAEVKGAEKRSVGGHDVFVVKSEQDDNDSNMAGLELCTHREKRETICAVGRAAMSTKCTPAIPVEVESGCGVGLEPDPADLDDETRAAVAEIKKNATTRHATTSWSIANDGTVTVTFKAGARDLVDPRVIGSHVLWK